MRNKKNIVILLLIIVIIGVTGAVWYFWQMEKKHEAFVEQVLNPVAEENYEALFAPYPEDDGFGEVTIETLPNADQNQVTTLVDEIQSLEGVEIPSTTVEFVGSASGNKSLTPDSPIEVTPEL